MQALPRIIHNLDKSAEQLAKYLADSNNTAKLLAAIEKAKTTYMGPTKSWINPSAYFYWYARSHGPDFDELKNKLRTNKDQSKIGILQALDNFFDKATAWNTSSAAYTLFNDLVDSIFEKSQRDLLTYELLTEFKNIFLIKLKALIDLQNRLQYNPTQPKSLPAVAARFLSNISSGFELVKRDNPGKLADNEQHQIVIDKMSRFLGDRNASPKTPELLQSTKSNKM